MSKKTNEIIETKFFGLLETRPLSEISVSDITKACGINRNTFYYHYKNTADLLESVVKNMVDEVIRSHPMEYESLEDCIITALSLAQDNRKAIYNIYNSTSRAIFERHLWHVLDYTIASFSESLPAVPGLSDTEVETLKAFFKYECFGFVMDWIQKGMPDDAEEKLQVLIKIMLARTREV